jgi:hypothetical protein
VSIKIASCVILIAGLSGGCASSRVAQPAGEIATAVASLQTDLAKLQQSTRELQANEAALAARNFGAGAISRGALEQIETRQAVLDASSFAEMLEIFRTKANAHVAAQLAPPAPNEAPASASLPTAKLGAIASIVKKIAKPPSSKDGLKFLVEFVKKANDDLAALQKKQN